MNRHERHERALVAAAEYAHRLGRGDVVLAEGCARTIDDLVGAWDRTGPQLRWRWPPDVAAIAGITQDRRT